jgi:hypothetical protein
MSFLVFIVGLILLHANFDLTFWQFVAIALLVAVCARDDR